jgi:hypothetical protein
MFIIFGNVSILLAPHPHWRVSYTYRVVRNVAFGLLFCDTHPTPCQSLTGGLVADRFSISFASFIMSSIASCISFITIDFR